ncbi:MAG: cytochrome b/b6 domain-containing protein [Candidatus Thiodiazotropha sp. (ex Ctena orbiculata)]|nr:cytochrome b/b6 domain-containing protein [Candidatus Thiodiazotropha taylori]
MSAKRMIKVWDPFIRLFHWSLVTAFTICWVTEDELIDLHVFAGYLVAALLMARTVWGVIGTPYARFGDFVSAPRKVFSYLKDLLQFKAKRFIGHNPAGGAMIISLMIGLMLAVISGLLLYGAEGFGPLVDLSIVELTRSSELFEEVHESIANLTLLLVLLHLAGVLLGSLIHRENLLTAMITGKKRR